MFARQQTHFLNQSQSESSCSAKTTNSRSRVASKLESFQQNSPPATATPPILWFCKTFFAQSSSSSSFLTFCHPATTTPSQIMVYGQRGECEVCKLGKKPYNYHLTTLLFTPSTIDRLDPLSLSVDWSSPALKGIRIEFRYADRVPSTRSKSDAQC